MSPAAGHSVGPQAGTGGFLIEYDSTGFTPGQPLTLTVKHPDGKNFKGLLLTAHSADKSARYDGFSAPASGFALKSCEGKTSADVTHTAGGNKGDSLFTFTPPNTDFLTADDYLTFRAIVLTNYNTWYV